MAWSDEIAELNADCVDAFGEPIESYTRGAITLPTFDAIFSLAANADHVLNGDVPVDGTEPRLDVLHSSLGELEIPRRSDTFTARGGQYVVERVIPGTLGRSVCWCTEVKA